VGWSWHLAFAPGIAHCGDFLAQHPHLGLQGQHSLLQVCNLPLVDMGALAISTVGVGLVAVSDIVVATPKTFFSLSEVKLGLAPAVISPYVIAKMGASQARRYFLTGLYTRFYRENILLYHIHLSLKLSF